MSTVQEIEQAITALNPDQLDVLCGWLDENLPLLTDARLEQDIAAGRLDGAIRRALEHQRAGLTKPL